MLNCPMCQKNFRTRYYLNIHVVSHTKERPHKCPTCSATFTQAGGVKKHIKTEHEGVKYIARKNKECHLCSYKCSNKSDLRAHLQKHLAEEPLLFSCSIPSCSFKTNYKTSLQRHVQSVHHHDRPYKCTVEGCSYRASAKSCIRVHLKVHSSEKPFVCEFPGCKYATKSSYSLKLHTFGVHKVEKPFKCSTCNFQTIAKSRLHRHEDGHKSTKRFRCHFSNCSFATQRNEHLQLHFDNKHRTRDLMCKERGCNFRCGSIPYLNKHCRNHLLPTLMCAVDSCNYSARSQRNLRLHLSRQHRDLPSESVLVQEKSDLHAAGQARSADMRICPFPKCDYQTEFEHRYDRHMKSHDEETRKYVCKLCSHRFSSNSKLQRHLLTSHVCEKPYSCGHCDFATAHGENLRRHAQKVHHIYVVLQGKVHHYVKRCRTCSMICSSYSEFVLHSMIHLKAVVILERLNLQVTLNN